MRSIEGLFFANAAAKAGMVRALIIINSLSNCRKKLLKYAFD